MYIYMSKTNGQYFKDKEEAIAYYRANEENLHDKPDWLIECIIDFARQFPNYGEYCDVEARVKNGQELTAKQKKKYGHLKWEKETTDYKDGQVIPDSVEVKAEGEYEDIARDPEAREKYNKYGLEFPENMPESDRMELRADLGDGKFVKVSGDTETIKKDPLNAESWDIETIENTEK